MMENIQCHIIGIKILDRTNYILYRRETFIMSKPFNISDQTNRKQTSTKDNEGISKLILVQNTGYIVYITIDSLSTSYLLSSSRGSRIGFDQHSIP
mmetsp:Transcript_60591/g.148656  ORF Transcript_60591/g.148656 Transcript_60591/m.148656 type:complete len:96 (-) Transcript_60591:57-344(-)